MCFSTAYVKLPEGRGCGFLIWQKKTWFCCWDRSLTSVLRSYSQELFFTQLDLFFLVKYMCYLHGYAYVMAWNGKSYHVMSCHLFIIFKIIGLYVHKHLDTYSHVFSAFFEIYHFLQPRFVATIIRYIVLMYHTSWFVYITHNYPTWL